MNIKEGYFYFIKNEFFEKVKDSELMKNKENGIKRPCYYCFKNKSDDKIIWFIPLSSKIEKYKKIYNHKIEKQKRQGKKVSIDTRVLNLYEHGMKNIIFPDIDNILKQLKYREQA